MKYNYFKLQALGARFSSASAGRAHKDGIEALCASVSVYMCACENSHYLVTESLCRCNLVPLTGFLKGFMPALKCKTQKVINMELQLQQKIDYQWNIQEELLSHLPTLVNWFPGSNHASYLWALSVHHLEGSAGSVAQQMVATCGRGAAAAAPVWRLKGPRGKTGWKSESRLGGAGSLRVRKHNGQAKPLGTGF